MTKRTSSPGTMPEPIGDAPQSWPDPGPPQLRVLQDLERPDGTGMYVAGTIIPMDVLRPESVTILMERQIVILHLDAAYLAALPLA